MSVIGNYEDGLERTFNPDAPVDNQAESIQEDYSFFDGVSAGYEKGKLDEGIDVGINVRTSMFSKYEDYETNSKFYDAYSDMTSIWKSEFSEEMSRTQIDKNIASGRFTLVNGEVVDSDTSWYNNSFMYDMDAVKGALLAKANGFNNDTFRAKYQEYTKAETEKLAPVMQNSMVGRVVGQIGNYLYSQEGLLEVAGSPAKITGKTIASMAMKGFGVEAGLALAGGIGRERRKLQHAELADLDYGLAESAENVLWEMGIAGALRAAGSLVLDGLTLKQVKKRMSGKWGDIDATDKDILERYFRREDYKLTKSSIKHEDLIRKSQMDIDDGKMVEVADELDIPIESKLTEEVEPVSIRDEIATEPLNIQAKQDVNEIEKVIDDIEPFTETTPNMKYKGMADDAEGDAVIEEIAKIDPEIEAELKALNAEEEALKSRRVVNPKDEEAARLEDMIISEDELAAAKKQLYFGKSTNPDVRYKDMSKKDITEQDRVYNENLANEAETVFAKGGDNLAAGTVAGIEEDENGNITFDPAKFVLGLGGYTAVKALAKNKTLQKEFKGYVERSLNELETNAKFNYLTGKQNIIDSTKNVNDKNLLVTHNISESSLEKAEKSGGLIAPSLAVVKAEKGNMLKGYGDIILAGKKDLVDPKKDMRTVLYDADIYSPRVPKEVYDVNKNEFDKMVRELGLDDKYSQNQAKYLKGEEGNRENTFDDLYRHLNTRETFLNEQGIKVKNGNYSEIRKDIESKIKRKDKEFKKWINDKLDNVFSNPSLKDGSKYTPSNLVDFMFRGGNVGKEAKGIFSNSKNAGEIRSVSSKLIESISDAKDISYKLASYEDMKPIQQEFIDRLSKLKLDMAKDGSYEAQDEATKLVFNYANTGSLKGVKPEFKDEVKKFIKDIQQAKTQYFEAKLKRIVKPGEFKIAVVPRGTDKKTIKYLREEGLKIKMYDKGNSSSMEDELIKSAKSNNILFMHPAAVAGGLAIGTISMQQQGSN